MKNTAFAILLVLITVFLIQAQPAGFKSIHQLEYEAHQWLPKQPSFFDSLGRDIIRLNKRAALQKPSKVIFGYLPYWEYVPARDYLQYDLLTHIAVFDFGVSSSGNISKPSYWPWTDVINAAHNNGVKVILTAVNFNGNDIHNLLTSSQAKTNFFSNLKSLLATYNLDGVNIDFEGVNTADRGTLLNSFMADLTQNIKQSFPDAEISFAGPAVNWGGWDLKGLAASCDYIFIMGYAFSGSWSSSTGANAPLTGGNYNILNTVTVQYAEVTNNHPEKLILGLPYYGNRWKTTSSQPGASVVEFKGSVFYAQAEKEALNYGRVWHSTSQTPWYHYRIGSQWYQVWFDDAQSLALKYDLADEKQLLGVGMWALGYDASRPELWNLLRQRYLPETTPPPQTPQACLVKPGNSPGTVWVEVDSVFGAEGYEIFASSDAKNFSKITSASTTRILIENLLPDTLYYFKIRSFNQRGVSAFTSVLPASSSPARAVLLVDGFERNDQGNNTYDYLKYHARAFYFNRQAVASATNEALISGLCQPDSFLMVDWMLGDEGQADFTFNADEKELVRQYLQNGGRLLVSGAEIGYDLVERGSDDDRNFFTSYLKAQYVNDAPLGKKATYYQAEGVAGTPFAALGTVHFDNGTHGTYDVDWPDAILPAGGAKLGMAFKNVSTSNGGAAIYYAGKFGSSSKTGVLLYFTFPLETVYLVEERNQLIASSLNFLLQPTAIDGQNSAIPQDFQLIAYFPNPFNGEITFKFRLSQARSLTLRVYDIRGQLVYSSVRNFAPGIRNWHWIAVNNQGLQVPSGTYLFSIESSGQILSKGKMVLVR